jgi:hypothetical protein
MPKKDLDTDDFIISETGNWNVAAEYSKLKIMKPLYLADEYADIAVFGTASLIEDLQLQEVNMDQLRILGFKRLVRCLITLIENTFFAIKKSDKDKELMLDFKLRLIKIEKIIPALFKFRTNSIKRTKELYLVKKDYDKVLEEVLKIKAEINAPLNRNHLIFTDKEEFDPKKFKEALKDRMINKG